MKTVQIKVGDSEFICQLQDCDYRNIKEGNIIPVFIQSDRVCRVMFVQVPPQGPGQPSGIGMTSKAIGSSGYKSSMLIATAKIEFILEIDEETPMYKEYIKQTTNIAIPSVNVNNILKK